MLAAFNLHQWIDEHRHLLKPPVGNAQVFKNAEFIIMVVGGPNRRKDYHVDPSEEFFYQLEGDMVLKVVEDGQHRDIAIRAGDIFLLPGNVPHSPRRPANTVGLVVERARRLDEWEAFEWYCESCGHRVYRKEAIIQDITRDLAPIFDAFLGGDIQHRTCSQCNEVIQA